MDDTSSRLKTFISLDSLWYEEERLATFIDWPVKFLFPKELAANGFYYLRSEDHCACAFCRGIVGAWEEGDTPEREHKRHFPNCPFVRGLPTPNVSISLGRILSKCNKGSKHRQASLPQDICGTKKDADKTEPKTVILPSGKALMNSELSSVGLHLYSGPKKKDFITYETRLESFKNWPGRVLQKPQDLAEAGFYYCGVSDHVRCFHCGNGLRNWEADDHPWKEHARWYPDCNFILLTKGIDFIDKVRRERPPYLPSTSNHPSSSSAASKANSHSLTEIELEKLLDLPVMKSVLEMGFDRHIVKAALHKKLEQTGVPFFTTESCIESILQMGDINQNQGINRENLSMQEKKLQAIQGQSPSLPTSTNDASSRSGTASTVDTLPQTALTNISPMLPPLPNMLNVSPPLRSSTPTSQVEQSLRTANSPHQSLEVTEREQVEMTNQDESITPGQVSNEDDLSMQVSTPVSSSSILSPVSSSPSPSTSSSSPSSISSLPSPSFLNYRHTSNIQLTNNDLDPLIEAEQVIEEADKVLGNKPATEGNEEDILNKKECCTKAELESKELSREDSKVLSNEADKLAEELEKLRECRMCRVCMDKDMDIVFLPCTHMVACSSCAVALTVCPICRRSIQYAFKPIIS